MNKVTKIFLFFLAAAIISLTTSCRSSNTAYKSRSSTTGRAYVKKSTAKSGNKRSNHRSKSTAARKAPAKSGVSARAANTGKAGTTSSNDSKSVAVPASAKAQQVIKAARKYIGTPYRYGGTTSKGMDCSGLLCTSFEAVDIKLPRVSHEQAKYGTEVRLASLAPGDLVFFSEKKGSGKISHVGMVTDVRGRNEVRFIHSSTSRGVIEDNLYSDYFQRIFVKAVRPF